MDLEYENDDDVNSNYDDDFVVLDTEILSLSFFNNKKSLAIIEIEKKNNEKKELEQV
jgi:hypothetical protein